MNSGPCGLQKTVVFDGAQHAAMPAIAIGLARRLDLDLGWVTRRFGYRYGEDLDQGGFSLEKHHAAVLLHCTGKRECGFVKCPRAERATLCGS
jgi:hypothetical protein